MKLIEIDHVQITIPPGKEAEAREFYCGLLELRETAKPESLAGRGGLWLQIGVRQVHLGVEEKPAALRSKAHVAYRVDSLEDWRRRLAAAGIETIDGISIPGVERFEFRDPFGNRIEFVESAG